MMHDRQRLEAQNDKTEQRGGVLFDHPVVIYRKSCSRINCIHVSACSRKKKKKVISGDFQISVVSITSF